MQLGLEVELLRIMDGRASYCVSWMEELVVAYYATEELVIVYILRIAYSM